MRSKPKRKHEFNYVRLVTAVDSVSLPKFCENLYFTENEKESKYSNEDMSHRSTKGPINIQLISLIFRKTKVSRAWSLLFYDRSIERARAASW